MTNKNEFSRKVMLLNRCQESYKKKKNHRQAWTQLTHKNVRKSYSTILEKNCSISSFQKSVQRYNTGNPIKFIQIWELYTCLATLFSSKLFLNDLNTFVWNLFLVFFSFYVLRSRFLVNVQSHLANDCPLSRKWFLSFLKILILSTRYLLFSQCKQSGVISDLLCNPVSFKLSTQSKNDVTVVNKSNTWNHWNDWKLLYNWFNPFWKTSK